MAVATLQSLRNDTHFDNFWGKLLKTRNDPSVDELVLPRKRCRHLDDGDDEPEFVDSKQYYRLQYLARSVFYSEQI